MKGIIEQQTAPGIEIEFFDGNTLECHNFFQGGGEKLNSRMTEGSI